MNLRTCSSRLLALFVFATIIMAANAAADEGDIEAGINAGAYVPLLSYSQTEKFHASPEFGYGILFGYDLTDQFAFEFNYLHAAGKADIGEGRSVGLVINELMAGASWSILTGPVRPRFLGGLDGQLLHAERPVRSDNSFGFHFGLGLTGVLKPYLHVGITARYHYLFSNRFETDNAFSVLATASFLF